MSPLPAFSASGVMAAAASGAEGFITSMVAILTAFPAAQGWLQVNWPYPQIC